MTTQPPASYLDLLPRLAADLGFDLVGIAPVEPSRHPDAYRQWIATGQHGAMSYLARNLDERLDLTKKFPWAKSVISVALAYWQETPQLNSPLLPSPNPPIPQSQIPAPSIPQSPPLGRIARYAWGRDYHRVLGRKLQHLESRLRAALAPLAFEARAYTDTGPLLERELALRAGLGWIGKHTLLIHPKHGSYFLLGELITSLDPPAPNPAPPSTPFPPTIEHSSTPAPSFTSSSSSSTSCPASSSPTIPLQLLTQEIPDHCGSCTRCIDACPTAAITPYHVDATRCISYHTLENRGPIPPDLHPPMAAAGFLIGCDICQEVCPFNRRPLPTTEPDFAPAPPAPALPLATVLAWTETTWDHQTRGRAHRRAKFPMWQRNAQILAKITPTTSPT